MTSTGVRVATFAAAVIIGAAAGVVATVDTGTAAGASQVGFTGGCTLTEGAAAACTITITPPAPADASFTFALTPRIFGQGAYTPTDAAGRPVGGTGADIATATGGTSMRVPVPLGATSVTFPVTVTDDPYAELDETIVATLSDPAGMTVGVGSVTITVVDNDRTGIFDPANYGATANNAADDDWAGIQGAVDAASAGAGRGVVTFGTPGTYDVLRLNSGNVVTIDATKGIAIVGYGATVKRKAGACAGASSTNVCAHRLFTTGGTFNGNTDTPWTVVDGLTIDGNRQQLGGPWAQWQSEQAHSLFFAGDDFTEGVGRVRAVAQNLTDRNSPADGVSIHAKVQFVGWNNNSADDFRGGFVLTGGYTIIRLDGWTTRSTNATYPTGIDTEIDGFGPGNNATTDFEARNLTIDGDLDVGSFLPGWAGGCLPAGCGGGSRMLFDNVQMLGSGVTLATFLANDRLVFRNSTLRWGQATDQLGRIIYAAGNIRFEDTTHIFTADPPSVGIPPSGRTGIDIYWMISGYTAATPARITFLRNAFVNQATNTCIRQYSQFGGTTLELIDSQPVAANCPAPGYTGTAVVTGSGGPSSSTTTIPPATTTSTTTSTVKPATTTVSPTASTSIFYLRCVRSATKTTCSS